MTKFSMMAWVIGTAVCIGAAPRAEAADVPGGKTTKVKLAVVDNSLASRCGTFEFVGDSDWYRLTLKKNFDYAIYGNGDPSISGCNIQITLRDAKGKILRSTVVVPELEDDGFEFHANKAGTYYLEYKYLRGNVTPARYAYLISGDCRGTSATPCELSVGTPRAGTLLWHDDLDNFKVRLSAGIPYELDITSPGDIQAYLDDGHDGVYGGPFTVDRSGTYVVQVYTFADNGTAYTVGIRRSGSRARVATE